MDVIIPELTTSLTSNIPEPDTYDGKKEGSLWSSSTAYKKDDVCFKDHVVYKSLVDGNTNNEPKDNISTTSPKWRINGPTNFYAAFDSKVYTASERDTEIVMTMDFNRCTGFAVFNMSSYDLNVKVVSEGAAIPIFDKNYDLLVDRRSRWRYRYEQAAFAKNIFDTTVGVSPKAKIQFTFKSPMDGATPLKVSVGMIVVGRSFVLGKTEWGVSSGSRNYSKIIENEFGSTDISPGLSTNKIRGTLAIDPMDTDRMYSIFRQVEKKPAAWICDNSSYGQGFRKYESLSTFGYLNSFDSGIETYGQTRIQYEILGLI